MTVQHIIDGKRFDPDTSKFLFRSGNDLACRRSRGQLTVYRACRGTIWAVLKYWPDEAQAQHVEAVAGDAAVRGLCEELNRPETLKRAFGELEEG